MSRRVFPWLVVQFVVGNLLVAAAFGAFWLFAFRNQSAIYLDRLMKQFSINPDELHSMYVSDVQRDLWLAAAAAALTALVISIAITVLVLRPVRALSKTAQQVATGDYSARATARRGEIGALGRDFNAMVEALDQEEQRRNRYLADLSHELRTPITSIRGFIEGHQDGIFKPDARYFETLSGELDHLTELTKTIDRLSLDGANTKGDSTNAVNVSELTAIAVERWRPRFAKLDMDLDADIRPGLTCAIAATQLRLLLDNLLSNVERHGEPNHPVKVTLDKARSSSIVLTTENHSGKLTQADLPHLFERFYRADRSRSRASNNVGLGLAIVKQIVTDAGGSIEAALDGQKFQMRLVLPRK